MTYFSTNQSLVTRLNVVLHDVYRAPEDPLGTKPLSKLPMSELKVGDQIYVRVASLIFIYRVI